MKKINTKLTQSEYSIKNTIFHNPFYEYIKITRKLHM